MRHPGRKKTLFLSERSFNFVEKSFVHACFLSPIGIFMHFPIVPCYFCHIPPWWRRSAPRTALQEQPSTPSAPCTALQAQSCRIALHTQGCEHSASQTALHSQRSTHNAAIKTLHAQRCKHSAACTSLHTHAPSTALDVTASTALALRTAQVFQILRGVLANPSCECGALAHEM